MIVFGLATTMAFAIVGFASWLWLRRAPGAYDLRLAVVVCALCVMSVGATWVGQRTGDGADHSESGVSLAWPIPPKSSLVTSAQTAKAPQQAASVDSLVGGLEARLEANPNDGDGWALLAQSYAYTANEEAVERAFERAVALGIDGTTLRERIDHAKRSAPAIDWVDRAIGTRVQ